MKLSDWAKKQGISYLTAYRWFKDGKLPSEAYQSESGTIIVKDESETLEQPMASGNHSNDIMSIFLKKTVEFSKNNSTVEDFAAYVLSNFSLKLNSNPESPKYSRNKPKSEDIQKHFQQFLKPKGEKPEPNMFVTEADTLNQLIEQSDGSISPELVSDIKAAALNSVGLTGSDLQTPEMQSLIKDLSAVILPAGVSDSISGLVGNLTTYDSLGHLEGVVSRNVDVTPQSFNYTGSTHSAFSASATPYGSLSVNAAVLPSDASMGLNSAYVVSNGYTPSPTEIAKAHQSINKLAEDLRTEVGKAKRGRKPSKKALKKQ